MSSHQLHCISPTTLINSPISITFTSKQLPTGLAIQFQVVVPISYEWNQSEHFNLNPIKNWGLWEYDVVELFWQIRKDKNDVNAPYYEWQIAPNNKAFALEIYNPRISYATPLSCPIQFLGNIREENNKKIWLSTFFIPESLSAPINLIAIGAFAMIGPNAKRQLFSLNPIKMNKPDFHIPQNFLPLSSLQ